MLSPGYVTRRLHATLRELRERDPATVDSLAVVVFQPQPEGGLKAVAMSTDPNELTLPKLQHELGRDR
jgi:hypothetical protein